MSNLHPTLLHALTNTYVHEAFRVAETRRAAREAAALERPQVDVHTAVAPTATVPVARCRPG